jgi:hypothetical protein
LKHYDVMDPLVVTAANKYDNKNLSHFLDPFEA